MGTIDAKLNALLAPDAAPMDWALIEPLVTTGYAEALRLDVERRRAESPTAEVCLAQRTAQLRARLAEVRQRYQPGVAFDA